MSESLIGSAVVGQKNFQPRNVRVRDAEEGLSYRRKWTCKTDSVFGLLPALGSTLTINSQVFYLKTTVETEMEGGLTEVEEVYTLTGYEYNAAFGSGTTYETDLGFETLGLLYHPYFASVSDEDRDLLSQLITGGPLQVVPPGVSISDAIRASSDARAIKAMNLILNGVTTFNAQTVIYRIIQENGSQPTNLSGVGQAASPSGAPTLPSGYSYILEGAYTMRGRGMLRSVMVYKGAIFDPDLI